MGTQAARRARDRRNEEVVEQFVSHSFAIGLAVGFPVMIIAIGAALAPLFTTGPIRWKGRHRR